MLDFPPDWTFAIQFVGFFAVLAFLDRYLFRPFVDVLDRRESSTHGAVRDADSDRRIAAELKEQIAAAVAQAKTEAHAQADKLRRESQAKESAILEQAKSASAESLGELRGVLDREVKAARAALESESRALADQVVAAVLGRKAS